MPARAQAQRTTARFIDLAQLCTRRDDLGLSGEIGARHVLAKVSQCRVGVFNQVDTGRSHLAQVVRRYVSGHAHGDAGRAVEQHVGQTRRQHRRLFQCAVEIGQPLDGSLTQLGQQDLRIGRQPGLGVTHRSERFGVIRRTPVTLSIDQRIAVGEILRHQHHRLVARAVAVRMELAEHVADGARRFLMLGGRRQPKFGHRIDDAPLHWLEAVADIRQRPVQNHVHGIVEVGLFGKAVQRQLLYAFGVVLRFLVH